jgi:hypothetical protein
MYHIHYHAPLIKNALAMPRFMDVSLPNLTIRPQHRAYAKQYPKYQPFND